MTFLDLLSFGYLNRNLFTLNISLHYISYIKIILVFQRLVLWIWNDIIVNDIRILISGWTIPLSPASNFLISSVIHITAVDTIVFLASPASSYMQQRTDWDPHVALDDW